MNWVSWESLLRLCEVVSIAAGIITVAALIGQVTAGRVLNKRQGLELEKLKLDVATQRERAAKAEKDLLEVQEYLKPRRPSAKFWEALKGKPAGVIFEIMRDPRAEDGYTLGSEIVSVILAEGWTLKNTDIVELPLPEPLKGSDAGAFSDPPRYQYGIRIEASQSTNFNDTQPNPYRSLSEAFKVSGLGHIASDRVMDLPENSFRIVIGRKEPMANRY